MRAMEQLDRSKMPVPKHLITGGGIGAGIGIFKEIVLQRGEHIAAVREEVVQERTDRPQGFRELVTRRLVTEGRVLARLDFVEVAKSAGIGGAMGASEEIVRESVRSHSDNEELPPSNTSELW